MTTSLFELSLKARIPFIGGQYSDLANFQVIIADIAAKPIHPLPKVKGATVGEQYVYWTNNWDEVTVENYKKLCEAGAVCVFINPDKTSPLVFDAGSIPTPQKFFISYLSKFVAEEKIPEILPLISPLSLKDAQNLLRLTMVSTGSVLPKDIRRTQALMTGATPGLEAVETKLDFYITPKSLQDWIDLNEKYFGTESKLSPRGLMLTGAPGVGKSSAAIMLSRHLGIPLFRLDIGAGLSRWLGEGEKILAKNLQLVDSYGKIVLLIDEIEKVFKDTTEGTVTRLLSQLLWWLQNRKSLALVIMTSNNLAGVPKELYRPGRVDRVIELPQLSLSEAEVFAIRSYADMLGSMPHISRVKIMQSALTHTGNVKFSHAEVTSIVTTLIKAHDWEEELYLTEITT